MLDRDVKRARNIGGLSFLALGVALVVISFLLSANSKVVIAGLALLPITGLLVYKRPGLSSRGFAKKDYAIKWRPMYAFLGFLLLVLIYAFLPLEWFPAIGGPAAGGAFGVAVKLLGRGQKVKTEFDEREDV